MPGSPKKKRAPKASAKGKKRILIIEDEKPLAHALELKLTREGYDVAVATTGTEGEKQALSGAFDAILLDLILPEVDGFAILKEIKEHKAKTVVIILSNLGQDEDRRKAAEFGAKQYLVKSNVPLADIIKVVKQAI